MGKQIRLLVALAVLAASGTAGLLLDRRGTVREPNTPACLRPPAAVSAPDWLPDDLPFPPGTYVNEIIRPADPIHRAMLTTAGSLDDFVRFVLSEWPARGWKLGAGDREADEAEAPFGRNDGRFGQFRVRDVYCGDSNVEVLLILGQR